MKSLRPSLDKPVAARGMSKLLALLILLPLSLVELVGFVYMCLYGFRSMGEILFVLWLWNLAACIAFTMYILTYRRGIPADDNWKEVSNYLNLNKIGRDKF